MTAPLFVEHVLVTGVALPVVLHQARQWLPLPGLCALLGCPAEALQGSVVEAPALAQGAVAMLPVEGLPGLTPCINRTDLPLVLSSLTESNRATTLLWQAHAEGRLARDVAQSELHLLGLEAPPLLKPDLADFH